MAVTREVLEKWFKRGVKEKATHLIIVCDTWDHDDFPVFIKPTENVRDVEAYHRKQTMHQIMEVYNLALPMEQQLTEFRAFNY